MVVPARNTTHARKVDVNLMGGSITVKAYAGKEVIVEARGSSGRPEREREPDKAAEGMRRLDLPARGLSVEEENNVVTVRMQRAQRGELVISVPPDTSLKLNTMHGEIDGGRREGRIGHQQHERQDHLDQRIRLGAGEHHERHDESQRWTQWTRTSRSPSAA